MRKIKVIIKRPDEPIGHVTWISDTLENLQKTVGGNIEIIKLYLDDTPALIVCNEEGKLQGLEHNFLIPKDCIVGTAFVCGVSADGEDVADVPITRKEWAEMLKEWGNNTKE